MGAIRHYPTTTTLPSSSSTIPAAFHATAIKMNILHFHKLISMLIFTILSIPHRILAFFTKTARFPLFAKIGDCLLSAYFYYCGLSPHTLELDDHTTVHFWASRRRRHRRPNLLLIHGFGGDARWQFCWQIAALSADFNLFIPDLLFFGGSFTTLPDRTVENQARCMMEGVRRGFGVERVSVYAISYGGWVGYWMAEMNPAAVERIVIVSSGVGFTEEQRREHGKRVGRSIEDLLIPEGASELRALVEMVAHRHKFKWVPDFFLRQFIQVAHESHKKERRELLQHLLSQRPDSQYLPPISQETLLVWGDEDKVFPQLMAYQLQRHLGPKATVSIIKGCGHAVNLDAPFEANELIKSFILDRS